MDDKLMIVGAIVTLASFGSTLFGVNWRIILPGIILFGIGRLLKIKQQLDDMIEDHTGYYDRS